MQSTSWVDDLASKKYIQQSRYLSKRQLGLTNSGYERLAANIGAYGRTMTAPQGGSLGNHQSDARSAGSLGRAS